MRDCSAVEAIRVIEEVRGQIAEVKPKATALDLCNLTSNL